MTIKELHDEYMAVKKHEVRATSWEKTRWIMERYILPTLGPTRLDKFGPSEVQKWKLGIETRTTATGQPYKIQTKRNIFKELSAMMNYAVKMEYISRNPLRIVGTFKDVDQVHEPIQYYTVDEFRKFIAASRVCAEQSGDGYEWHYFIFFCIAFLTGLRKGEIHALQWSDINGQYLSVTKSIIQKLKGDDVETPPKNKTSIRTLQMPKPLIDILAKHRKRCEAIEGFSETHKIFGGDRPLRDTTILNRNIAYAKAAGVKSIRIHDFRHSHASLLANEGINIQEISRRLGHSKIEITWNTYSHLYPREEERAVAILNKVM
jgi:integrase